MAQAQINTCYWHLTKFTFAPPSIRPKLSIILHLPLSLFRKFPPTLLFNWNWKLEYGFKLLRRYSRVSDLNISKDQRKKHRPYYNINLMTHWFELLVWKKALPFTLDNPYFFKKNILTFSLLFRGRALESLNKSYSKYIIIKLLEPFQFNHPGTCSMVFF